MVSKRQWRIAGIVGITLIYASVSLTMPAGFGLLAFGDLSISAISCLPFWWRTRFRPAARFGCFGD
jgi:hypothetical protein